MKTRLKLIIPLVAAIASAACSKYADDQSATGALTLRIVMPEQSEQQAAATTPTRAMSQDELLNSTVVKIYNGDFTGLVREFAYSDMTGPIYLPAESYRIDVHAGEEAKAKPAVASFDQKSYKGSQEFTVTAGTTTTVQVAASVSNAITAVTFDETVPATFTDYKFTIGLDAEDAAQQLVYTAANAGAEGYFIASGFEPSLYWTFSGTRIDGSEPFTKSGEIAAVEPGKKYTMNIKYTNRNGELAFDLVVDTSTDEIDDEIIFEPVSTGLSASSAYEIWAGHATVHADVDETEYGTENIFFEYRPSVSEGEWSRIAATRDEEGVYSTVLKALTPETEYEYRLLVPDPQTKEPTVAGSSLTFTTEAAPAIPNGGFETISKTESSKFYSFYNPASEIAADQTKWWDSGNAGSTYSISTTTITDPDTSVFKEGAQSVRLHSETVMSVKFAAGNIFCGEFAGVDGTNGRVNFGRPFSGRPTALRFWVKYIGGKVDKAGGPEGSALTTSDFDKGQIKFALGTWDNKKYGGSASCPVQVYTADKSTFWDISSIDGTIAYADIILQGDGSEGEWQQVTLTLDYKDETAIPKYIIISAAASMYGDYFAGSSGSRMWLDGMELIYE
ncbi:MAG: DUF4493 domain-containing protein [Alistipes sp.]|nr:DUF4493 domain-containing protein [Alistipes sp.]